MRDTIERVRDSLPSVYRDADGDIRLEWLWAHRRVVSVFFYRWGLGWAYLWGKRKGHGRVGRRDL